MEKCIGQEAKYEGIRLLFDGFQQPLLNKQVKLKGKHEDE
jgi:sorting nexin-14